MSGNAEAHVVVSGLVQGVFYRATTRDVARGAGVKGYVRNLPDGRVEAVLQGDRARIEQVISFMRAGPPGARVTDVAVSWRPRKETYDGFFVRQ
jgi:acylphosphatase